MKKIEDYSIEQLIQIVKEFNSESGFIETDALIRKVTSEIFDISIDKVDLFKMMNIVLQAAPILADELDGYLHGRF